MADPSKCGDDNASAVRLVIVLWGALFVLLNALQPMNDGDLYWQRWLGDIILKTHHIPMVLGPETFTSSGAPWVPQEWFLSILVALAMDHGLYVLLSALCALVPTGVLLCVYLTARRWASCAAIAVILVMCGAALDASLDLRAQVLGWGCFAIFLLLLRRRDHWYYGTIPIVIIWANVHASVALAPAFLAARILGELFDGGEHVLAAKRDLKIFPFVGLALLCTPLGWHLPAYALMLATSPIRQYIQEWQPVQISDLQFLLGSLPLAILILVGGWRQLWRNKGESLPLVILFGAMLTAVRHVPVFAIAAGPMAAYSLDQLAPRIRNLSLKIAEMEKVTMASVCVTLAIVAGVDIIKQRQADPQTLIGALTSLAADNEQHRLLCENFNACSAALGYPNLRVFMDGRCDPFPVPVWRTYVATVRVEPTWRKALDRYGVDVIIATRGSAFNKALAKTPEWRSSFENDAVAVFRRT